MDGPPHFARHVDSNPMTTVIDCFAMAPFMQGVPVALTDSQTLQPVVFYAAMQIFAIYAHAEMAFSANATIEVGWAGAPGAFVSASENLNTAALNAANWRRGDRSQGEYDPGAQSLVLTADQNVTSGEVRFKLLCHGFDSF